MSGDIQLELPVETLRGASGGMVHEECDFKEQEASALFW